MNRPYIICLMMTSADGKILSQHWGSSSKIKALVKNFEKAHEKIGIPSWLCGRVTMERDFTNGAKPVFKKGEFNIQRVDFVGDKKAESFAIAIDGDGKLGWEKNSLYGDHAITVLTEKVSDAYLAHLQEIGVSYVFAGKDNLDLNLALKKIYKLFPINKLMLEGGGHINGSFLSEGLIDELNLLILPVVDGNKKNTSVFEVLGDQKKKGAALMKLKSVKKIKGGVVWLKYKL